MKNQINIEMIYQDNIMDENCNDLNMKIVRRRDNNRIFKLCYDLGDSLCQVYELKEGKEISMNEDQVYGEGI